jgi:SanA protein
MNLKSRIINSSKWLLLVLSFLVVLIFVVDYYVSQTTQKLTYNSVEKVPYHKVGLLLGTSKYQKIKGVNLFYVYRLDAAEALYRAGKISFILISGDNAKMSYNEPIMMKKDLIKRGIPENKIFLDFAGFRTLDSVIRASKVFQENSFTIISQQFQNERALYIAKKNQLDCVAFNAQEVSKKYGFFVAIREKFARVKMLLDFVFNVTPKFLGDPVKIE